MRWRKCGLVYVPEGRFGWDQSHAAMPTVDVVDDRVWRIYYSSRDSDNCSRIGYIEVDAGDPARILYIHPEPILELGNPGTFDDRGTIPSWVLADGPDIRYLYYVGCTTRQTVPFHNSIGLAISRDGGRNFQKAGEGPLFGPILREPYFNATCCVLAENGLWRMWYLSCTKWEVYHGRIEPFYHLKYASSANGIDWRRDGTVAVELKTRESGIARPSVIHDGPMYQMWYSYRQLGDYRSDRRCSYRIGYAESPDGITWQRLDQQADIEVSDEGWDSQMIAYPHVVQAWRRKVLFYNGNGFGKSGFGYAVHERD
jgi:hypothetical protein